MKNTVAGTMKRRLEATSSRNAGADSMADQSCSRPGSAAACGASPGGTGSGIARSWGCGGGSAEGDGRERMVSTALRVGKRAKPADGSARWEFRGWRPSNVQSAGRSPGSPCPAGPDSYDSPLDQDPTIGSVDVPAPGRRGGRFGIDGRVRGL